MDTSREESSAARPILSLGRYALFGELATGGMATVHYGRMSSLGGFNRTVAIKRMRPDIARDPEFVAMFLDEARLTSRIEHPNVVATLDVVAESGEVFLVMEYVRGESLQRLRRASKSRRERIPVPVAISVMVGALSGLHAAHEAVGENGVPLGIIHRDVSPQNIMVGEDGITRITDFGIAKAESRLQVTHEGQMKGKLPYMAPEQLGSGRKRIDRRVDIFSAAVVFWELLAGKALFRADHPGETIAKVLSAPIPALAPFRSDVTPELDRVIRRGLSRKPDQRPKSAEEFALELEEAIATGPASPRVVGKWVSSLAGDVLANRLKYVREMESTSWRMDDAPLLAPRTGLAVTPPLSEDDISSLPSVDPDPEPPARKAPPPPRAAERPLAAPASPAPPAPPVAAVPAPPKPDHARPFPTGAAPLPPVPPRAAFASNPSALATPPPVVPVPPVASTATPAVPDAPHPAPAPQESSEPRSLPEPDAAAPPPADESSMPSVPSHAAMATGMTRASLSVPPFKKSRILPVIIVGSLVGTVVLLLVIGVVSSSSWFDDVPAEPASTSTQAAPTSPTSDPTPTVTNLPATSEPEVLDSGEIGADAAPDVEQDESPPFENDKKGGSSGTSKTPPGYTPPSTATPKGTGVRPYLPDLP